MIINRYNNIFNDVFLDKFEKFFSNNKEERKSGRTTILAILFLIRGLKENTELEIKVFDNLSIKENREILSKIAEISNFLKEYYALDFHVDFNFMYNTIRIKDIDIRDKEFISNLTLKEVMNDYKKTYNIKEETVFIKNKKLLLI